MTDAELVQQALRELWDIVKCRCNEAYTGRGLHDPDCECDSTDALQIVTEAIQILTEQLAAARHDAKEAEVYAEELEQQLAKAVEALDDISSNGNAAGRNPQLMADKARATLAEIKLQSSEFATQKGESRD